MLKDRFDPLPFQRSFFLRRLADGGKHEFVRFSRLATGFNNGFALGRELQSDEKTSFIQLRPTNMDSEGRWLFEKVTHLDHDSIPASAKFVSKGDLVFNNTNSQQLVGKTGVWDGSIECKMYLSNHMTQIILNDGFIPEVYAYVLNIYRQNRVFFNLCTNWNNQSGFAGERLRALPLPKLPYADQVTLADIIKQGRMSAQKKNSNADALLASIDDYLLSELGIVLPPEPESTIANRMFRTNAHELGGWRFDPHALEPDVEACRDATIALGNALPLRAVASFARSVTIGRTDARPYVGLEDVQSDTGILLGSDIENEFGSATLFEKSDVLFPKLRPYLNKVYYAEMHGCCSTEFHVLRSRMVDSEFLARFLRSKIIVRQTKHLMTGNTLPRLQTRDVERLLIPIPPKAIQQKICEEAQRREVAAAELRQEANAELEKAKREIEAILLGHAA